MGDADAHFVSQLSVRSTRADEEEPAEPPRRVGFWAALGAALLCLQASALSGLGTPCHTVIGFVLPLWPSALLLGCFLDHRGRFRADNELHVSARRWAFTRVTRDLLTIFSQRRYCSCVERALNDPRSRDPDSAMAMDLACILNVVTNVTYFAQEVLDLLNVAITCQIAMLRVYDLGQTDTGYICKWLLRAFLVLDLVPWATFAIGRLVWFHLKLLPILADIADVLIFVSLITYVLFWAAALWGMLHAASSAQAALPLGAPLAEARKAIFWSRLTAGVSAATCVLSIWGTLWELKVTNDEFLDEVEAWQFQIFRGFSGVIGCLYTAMLSTLVGPRAVRESSERAFAEVARLRGFALQQVRRITFAGQVGSRSQQCIVSFPGVYADLWQRVTELRAGQASVACVFLPSAASGLGKHAPDPDNPGNPCYCSVIYPPFQAPEYLRVVQRPEGGQGSADYPERLAFERADAAAQGIHLLVEGDYPKCMWEWAKLRGKRRAQQLCKRNGHLAPWGCLWFARWVENVEQAVAMGQELIVFYKQDKVCCGRLDWHELADSARVAEATAGSGLGASQRVEVAYLEKMGYGYTAKDVTTFTEIYGSSAG